jgi:outer membrane protein
MAGLVTAMCLLMGAPSAATEDAESSADGPATDSVDLARAIELAVKNNPELAAAASEVDVAAAQRDRAAAAYWPTLRALSGLTEYRRDQRLFPAARPGEPAVVSHQILGGDVLVSLPLYSGGRISGSVDAAKFSEEAARSTGRWTEADLTFRVSATYYAILAQRRLLSSLESSEQSLRQSLATLSALVEERKAAPVDRQRVEVRLSALRQRRVQEENALRVETLSLGSLMGIGPSIGAYRVVGELGPPSGTDHRAPAEKLRQKALKSRPDFQALHAQARSLERRVDVARAGYYPQLVALGSYGLRWGLWPSEQPAGTNALADVGQVGIYVDVPIFEGGRVSAEVRELTAQLNTLRERLRQSELRIQLEVDSAVLSVQAAMERLDLSETTVAQATEAFRVETEKQAVGKSTVTDVLSAQSDLLDAEADRARALADANIAVAALRRATGEPL